jgi:hypothetical protein
MGQARVCIITAESSDDHNETLFVAAGQVRLEIATMLAYSASSELRHRQLSGIPIINSASLSVAVPVSLSTDVDAIEQVPLPFSIS